MNKNQITEFLKILNKFPISITENLMPTQKNLTTEKKSRFQRKLDDRKEVQVFREKMTIEKKSRFL